MLAARRGAAGPRPIEVLGTARLDGRQASATDVDFAGIPEYRGGHEHRNLPHFRRVARTHRRGVQQVGFGRVGWRVLCAGRGERRERAPSGGSFGPTSVSVEWTGKFIDSEGDKQVPVYKVTNHFSKDIYYLKVWYYFYDGSKKQLGREFYERYSLDMKPGASQEMPLGQGRDKMVKGDVKAIQAVVVGATFADKGKWDGDVKTLAPDQRPEL